MIRLMTTPTRVFCVLAVCLVTLEPGSLLGAEPSQSKPKVPVELSAEQQQATESLVRLGASWAPRNTTGGVGVFLNKVEVTDEMWQQLYLLADKLEYLTGLAEKTTIADADLPRLHKLTALRVLDLNYSQITDQGLAQLKPLTNLEEVYLRGVILTGEGLAHLKSLPKLKVLYFYDATVKDAGLAHIGAMKKLERLTLSRTWISDAGLAHLSGLERLEWLLLSGTAVSDAGLVHVKSLTSLKRLNLTGTGITDAGLTNLRGLRGLEQLWLGGTAVTDAGVAQLHGLTALEELNVSGTRITDAGVAGLKTAVPGVKIEGALQAGDRAAGSKWVAFASEEQNFRALFPPDATVESRSEKTDDGGTKSHFQATSQGRTYTIDTMPTPLEGTTDRKVARAFLARVSLARAEAVGGELTYGKDVWVGPFLGWQFHHTSPKDKLLDYRLAVLGPERMFELAIHSPEASPPATADVEKFFTSFRIIEPIGAAQSPEAQKGEKPSTASSGAQGKQKPSTAPSPAAGGKKPSAAEDLASLQGEWGATRYLASGSTNTELRHLFTFKEDRVIHRIYRTGKLVDGLMFRVELTATTTPRQISYYPQEGPAVLHGIYALDGDALKLCSAPTSLPRPADFTTEKGDQRELVELQRIKPDTPATSPTEAAAGKPRGCLGVLCLPVHLGHAKEVGLSELHGVLVGYTATYGPAYRAGIRPGDILLKIDGERITDCDALMRLLKDRAEGAKASVLFARPGLQQEVELTLTAILDDKELLRRTLAEAENGVIAAQWFAGTLYSQGKGTQKSELMAAAWFRRAAEGGHAEAQSRLGSLYRNGSGVPENNEEAMRWTRAAADQGHQIAQTNVGYMYATGLGVARNYEEAVRWYRKAAETGGAQAQFNLADCYYFGRGVERNYNEAARWVKMSAAQKNTRAVSMLGWMYHMGHGVPQDDQQAVTLLQQAAETGCAEAQRNLGILYHTGAGVARDYHKSVTWFRRAADQGDLKAMHNLGFIYLRGQGVPQSRKEAIAWFRKAAAGGLPESRQNLRALGVRP